MCSISIRELTQEDSRQLASLLCEDCILRRDLGMAREDRPTGEAFDRHIRDWCRSRNAFTYAIVLGNGTVAGTISLSHIDRENHSARIGYWIGSSYRNRGYGTKAFEQVQPGACTSLIFRRPTTCEPLPAMSMFPVPRSSTSLTNQRRQSNSSSRNRRSAGTSSAFAVRM